MAAIHAAMEGAKPVEGNIYTASAVQIFWAGNDCTLTFTRPRPALLPTGGPAPAAMAEVVVIMQLSAATMKDLSVLLPEQVAKYEEKFGIIQTIFVKNRAAKKQSSAKH
jgi:hypothetical protein